MTDRPVLFSGPMVRALLAGRKTQTRRVFKNIKSSGNAWHIFNGGGGIVGVAEEDVPPTAVDFVPQAIGDRLWVREAWRTGLAYQDLAPSEMGGDEQVLFEADGATENWTRRSSEPGRLRVGMHMPRWASRLTLTVTDVRVQRLQDIDQHDAEAEGIDCSGPVAVNCFHVLWNSLNEDRGYGWDTNPWVVAVTFTVEHRNIDAVGATA